LNLIIQIRSNLCANLKSLCPLYRSIREAIESGLFDVGSGNLVNPISGRQYPVQRAVQMRLVQTSPEQSQQVRKFGFSKILILIKWILKYKFTIINFKLFYFSQLADALAQAQEKHGHVSTINRNSQFSPGSISLGSGAGVGAPYQRRSSFGTGGDFGGPSPTRPMETYGIFSEIWTHKIFLNKKYERSHYKIYSVKSKIERKKCTKYE
jgi:hypothetical protein